jgi:multiple sugar transport system permease protein
VESNLTVKSSKSAGAQTKRRFSVAQETVWGYIFIAPWLIGFVVFAVGPIVASFFLSFTRYELITDPVWIGADNYVSLVSNDRLFWLSLYNTAYYTLFGVPLGIIVAFLLAMLLNRPLPGIGVYRTVFYLPVVSSGVAISLLWIWLLNPQFGLVNYLLRLIGLPGPGWLVDAAWAKPAFILMSVWSVGGTVVIFLAGLQGVPRTLYEAAALDGANAWRQFWHVTVPMMSPVIFFTLVIGIIGSFQVFTQAYVMTGGGPQNATLFYVLYLFRQGFGLFRMGYAAAMAWILFLIILLLTLIQMTLARRWVYYAGDE